MSLVRESPETEPKYLNDDVGVVQTPHKANMGMTGILLEKSAERQMAGDKCAVSDYGYAISAGVYHGRCSFQGSDQVYDKKVIYTTRKQGPRQAASLKTNRIGFEKIHDENSG